MQKRFQDQVIVIVGATGGLGTAFAHAFANEGARLLLVSRNVEHLAQLADEFTPEPQIYSADMTDADSLNGLAEFVRTTLGQVDVVVNAAGVDVRKAFDQHSIADVHRTIDLNLTGAILLTRAFLPMLQQQSQGTMVHVGGFADGRLALPYFSVDAASRAGLATFIEALNRELDDSNINLLFFSPSPADTATERPFHPLWQKMDLSIAPSTQVALELLDAVAQRKRVHIMGGAATILFAKINAALPRLADILMLNRYRQILRQFFTASTPEPSASLQPTKPWSKRLGIGLVGASFLLYAGLALIPFIPGTIEEKIALSSAVVISGEVAFWIGAAIVGKEIVMRYRRWLNPCNWFQSKRI